MNTINVITMICVIIEVYHLLFYKQILSYVSPVTQIYRAAKLFERSLLDTASMMNIVKQNTWVRGALQLNQLDDEQEQRIYASLGDSSDDIKKTRKSVSNHALMLYIKDRPTGVLWYLGYVAIEFVYWILIVVLCCEIGGIYGVALILWSMIMSHINDWLYNHDTLNKHWNWFRIVDSVCCIVIYYAINYFAFILASS